jgi:uncharacterized protein (TIGR03435 family)
MRLPGAAVILVGLCICPAPLTAQDGPRLEPRLSFEVVSVKANPSRTRTPMTWQPGGHFVMGLPIFSLVSIGYLVPAYRIEGLPDWARTAFFDISAKADHQPEIEERPAYYRGLLVDRFHFAAHIERREMDVYTLTLARSDGQLGPGLRRSNVNCDQILAENRKRNLAGERPTPPPPGERPTCGAVGGVASMTAGTAELAPLLGMLAGALGKPVIDHTGLSGRFDFDFRAAPPNASGGLDRPLDVRDEQGRIVRGTDGQASQLPPISTALEDQLGLKIQAGRGSVDVLVIDHVEMPSEN